MLLIVFSASLPLLYERGSQKVQDPCLLGPVRGGETTRESDWFGEAAECATVDGPAHAIRLLPDSEGGTA